MKKYTQDEILEVFGLTKEEMKPNSALEKLKGLIPVVNIEGDFNLESIKPRPIRKASAQQMPASEVAARVSKGKKRTGGHDGKRPRKSSFKKENEGKRKKSMNA